MSPSQGFPEIPTQMASVDRTETDGGHPSSFGNLNPGEPGRSVFHTDRLLTAEDDAERLQVSKDWVWDHSSRKSPYLPVIRLGDGALRYRASKIEEFISERERLSMLKRGRR